MKNIRIQLIIILLLISSTTFGQTLSEKEIIGFWKVEKVSGNFPQMPAEHQKKWTN